MTLLAMLLGLLLVVGAFGGAYRTSFSVDKVARRKMPVSCGGSMRLLSDIFYGAGSPMPCSPSVTVGEIAVRVTFKPFGSV
jgi:hypothetical protein